MRFDNKPVKEHVYKPVEKFVVTPEIKKDYDEDGFIIVKNLFSKAEIDKFNVFLDETDILKHAFANADGEGSFSKLCIWNHPGVDYSSMFGRCERVVDTVESLLEGEVYHYHTKIVLKDAKTGGSFQWHQDYGYWYQNGLLFPEQMSVFVAIDRCDIENGCLKVLRGSHRLGRVDHIRVGGQTAADPARIEEIKKVLQEIEVIVDPGDALFFHCNVLHRSAQNKSDRRRYCIIPCYNRADNDSYFDHHHARYQKIDKVKDSDVIKCDEFKDFSGKWFMDPTTDKTIIGKRVES